jgi:hypothetical protein
MFGLVDHAKELADLLIKEQTKDLAIRYLGISLSRSQAIATASLIRAHILLRPES